MMTTPGTGSARPPSHSGEPEWVETQLPLLAVGLIGLVLYCKRFAALQWLAIHHIVIDPTHHPTFVLYQGYGLDWQRIVFLLLPALAAVVCSIIVGVAVWRNATAPRRPR